MPLPDSGRVSDLLAAQAAADRRRKVRHPATELARDVSQRGRRGSARRTILRSVG